MEQYLKDNPRPDNMLLKNEISLPEGFGLYADYFTIRGCGCLITGSGKTHTIRGVYNSKEEFLDMIYLDIKENAVFYGDIKTDYFINLISDNEINPDSVKEVSSDVYLKYAKGNYELNMNYEVASANIDACSKRNIVFIIVPWMETMEDRINAINTYFEYRFNK
jgi:hypothetical protein